MLHKRQDETQKSLKAAVALQDWNSCLVNLAFSGFSACGAAGGVCSSIPPPTWAALVVLQPQPLVQGMRSWVGLWEFIIYTSLL